MCTYTIRVCLCVQVRTRMRMYTCVHVAHMYTCTCTEKKGEKKKGRNKRNHAWHESITYLREFPILTLQVDQYNRGRRFGSDVFGLYNPIAQSNQIRSETSPKNPLSEKKSPREARFNLDLFGQRIKRGGPSDGPPRLCTVPLYLCSYGTGENDF